MSLESDFYRANVSETLDQRLIRHAAIAVRVAQIESRDYPEQELDAVPNLRRLNFHAALLDSTYAPGTRVSREEHNGGCHVIVQSGLVAITALTRSYWPRSVKLQPYQRSLAQGSQLGLFGGNEPSTEDQLWANLFFGAHYRSTRLTLCRIAFPTLESGFAPGTIDLLATYPAALEEFDDEEHASKVALEFIEMKRLRRQG